MAGNSYPVDWAEAIAGYGTGIAYASEAMRVMVPVAGDRVSPVLDVAQSFILVDVEDHEERHRSDVRIETVNLAVRARRIAECAPDVLICGAISWPIQTLLVSAGVRVIPNTCGQVEQVLAAFVAGKLTDQLFLMPGCSRKCDGRSS